MSSRFPLNSSCPTSLKVFSGGSRLGAFLDLDLGFDPAVNSLKVRGGFAFTP